MSRYRAGLHKEVSSIFKGVSLPKDDGDPTPSRGGEPAPEHQDYIAPEPPAPEPSPQEPPAPSHMTPTKPEPQQRPVQSSPKAAPAKKPKANTTIKTAWRILQQRTLGQIKNKLFAPEPGVDTTRQKVMMILALALFIVLISIFIRAFSTPPRKIINGAFGPARAAASSDSKADWQVPEPYPTMLRDPMKFGSVKTQTTETGGLIVKGIVYSKDNPAAVIGNQIVHEGDKVLDVVIVRINENSVEFEANNGKKWTQKVQR